LFFLRFFYAKTICSPDSLAEEYEPSSCSACSIASLLPAILNPVGNSSLAITMADLLPSTPACITPRHLPSTTNSNHKLPVAENLLNQDFTTNRPAAVWVTDISYINTYEGWLYLATVKDIFTKEIVGWATDNNMRTELCIRALENAVRRHKPPKGIIHHSDRGVQYCSRDYQAVLKKYGMICSMSRKGNCYDNACAETFFSTIKCEMLYHKRYMTREQARQDIFWYIEVFYNRKRRHQALGYITPAAFKQRYLGQKAA
jgi:putative transposase